MRCCRKDVFRLAAISESIQLEGFVTVPSRSIPSHFPFPFASFSFSPPCNTPRSLGTITRLLCSITDHPLLILGALRGAGAAVAAAACVMSWSVCPSCPSLRVGLNGIFHAGRWSNGQIMQRRSSVLPIVSIYSGASTAPTYTAKFVLLVRPAAQ